MNITEIAILSVIVGFARSFKNKKLNVPLFFKSFLLFFVALLAIDLLFGQFTSTDTKENIDDENIIWLIVGVILFILVSFGRKLFVRR